MCEVMRRFDLESDPSLSGCSMDLNCVNTRVVHRPRWKYLYLGYCAVCGHASVPRPLRCNQYFRILDESRDTVFGHGYISIDVGNLRLEFDLWSSSGPCVSMDLIIP
jgi:hypothetical protein